MPDLIYICSPNNPTGRVFTREELTELSQFIIKHDLICVCDQAFEDTAFPGHEMVTMASLPGMWSARSQSVPAPRAWP